MANIFQKGFHCIGNVKNALAWVLSNVICIKIKRMLPGRQYDFLVLAIKNRFGDDFQLC